MIERSILANQDWLNITISKRHAKIYLNERNVKNNNKKSLYFIIRKKLLGLLNYP